MQGDIERMAFDKGVYDKIYMIIVYSSLSRHFEGIHYSQC